MFKLSSTTLRQYLVIIIANLNVICLGLSIAWPSPVLLKLRDSTHMDLMRPVTEEEGSWIVSIGLPFGLMMNCFIGLLMDKLGRKTCLILSGVPRLIACLLLTFGTDVWMVLLARALDGVGNAFSLTVVPTYASEIASKEIRGALITLSQIYCSIGLLVCYAVGPFTTYLGIDLILTCIVLVTYFPLLFIPETPYSLYSQGRIEESLKLLTYLRGSEDSAAKEIEEYDQTKQTGVSMSEIFNDKIVLITWGKVILLGILLQLIGFNSILYYLQSILHSTQTTISEEVASALIGFIQMVAGLGTMLITDRFGRKPILIVSLVGVTLGMFGLGTFFELKDNGFAITGFINVLPLLSLILVIYCFTAGMGSIFWPVVAELFEGPARATCFSITIGISTGFVFLTTKYFATLTSGIGPAATYWLFGTCSIVTALLIMVYIPETKGKSFAEIRKELVRRNEM